MKWYSKLIIGVISMVFVVTNIIPVNAAGAEISIQMKNGSTVYKAGEKGSFTLSVKNTSDIVLNNISVQPNYSEDAVKWPFEEVDAGGHTRLIGALNPGQEVEISYDNLTVRSDVVTDRCNIGFTVNGLTEPQIMMIYPFTQAAASQDPIKKVEITNYQNGGSAENWESMSAGSDEGGGYEGGFSNGDVSSAGGGSSNGSVPRVIVTGFSTEPGEVKAGDNFRLIVHMKNTSKRTAVSNMELNFSAPTEGNDQATAAPAFLPTSGSSTVYLEKIGAEGTVDVVIDLNAKADLVQKPYSLDVSMKYEDSDATQYESNSSISIPIRQDARFEFSDIEISPEEVSVGDEVSVMTKLYNLGRIKLYNVKVAFEGAGISAKDTFVGNVEPGTSAAVDGMITTGEAAEGETTAKMIVTYEDEAGQVSTVEKEFRFSITAGGGEEAEMMGMEVPEQTNKSIVLPAVLVAIAVIGVITVVVIIRRKKGKNKGDGLNDELDRFIENE